MRQATLDLGVNSERVRDFLGLMRLDYAATDFDLPVWLLMKVGLPAAGLVVIPLLIYSNGHGLRGEIFEGGIVVYAIFLLIELLADLDRARGAIGTNRLSPSSRDGRLRQLNAFLPPALPLLAIILAVISRVLSKDDSNTFAELLFWAGLAVILGLLVCYLRLFIEERVVEELLERLDAVKAPPESPK